MTLQLTDSQQAADREFMKFLADPSQHFFCITGYAGCGKTTLLNHLIDKLYERVKMLNLVKASNYKRIEVFLAATTNKATSVVAENTQHLEDQYGDVSVLINQPKTIQSLLGLTVQTNFKTGQQFLVKARASEIISFEETLTVVCVDEASFIDTDLYKCIEKFAKGNVKFLFLGDEYQLAPPSGDSSRPIVFDQAIPMARLTEIMRNGGTIQALSQGYRQKVADFRKPWPQVVADQESVVYCSGDEFQQQVNAHFSDPEKAKQCRILAWTNERVTEYNNYIRSELLGYIDPLELHKGERMILNNRLERSDHRIDDVVLITDIRAVTNHIKPLNAHADPIHVDGYMVRFNHGTKEFFAPRDWAEVNNALKRYKRAKAWEQYYSVKNNWADLRPAYASTVHKAQGSTYQHVFVDLDDIGRCGFREPDTLARLLYVAMSRPRQTLYLYGELPQRFGGKPCVQLNGSLRECREE